MMMKSKSYDKYLTYRALYDALMQSLIVDEDDMDKQLEDQSTPKKRGRDDNDQDPFIDSQKEKKKGKQKDYESSKKDKDQIGSSKKGKSSSKSSKTDKSINAEETIHDVEMDVGESVEEDVVDAEDPSQADASIPKSDKSCWFKMIVVERPESPDPEWHKEPTADDAPKQTWFNEMVNAEKDLLMFDDVMVNPEGDRIPHDLSKPLPLHDAPGHLTILVNFFFNKDLEYLTNGNVEKKYATLLKKPKVASHKVYSLMKILSIIRISVDKEFGYGYLKEIVVRRANQREYTFKEVDFLRLHLNDIEYMYLLYTQNKLHHLTGDEQTNMVTACRFLIRRTMIKKRVKDVQLGVESYQKRLNITMPQFGDGTLKKVRDKLDYMLHNFQLGYNDGMLKRAWTDNDKRRTTSMLEKIEKTLLTRRIMRSLECFVGGRRIKPDYRLLPRIK
ncbi:hypothetical protein Tco_1492862 [Tanacetum coccineum]